MVSVCMTCFEEPTNLRLNRWLGVGVSEVETSRLSPDDVGPVSLVLDLCITHECWGSNSNPSLNGQLHYPTPADIDRTLTESDTAKILPYRADCNNRPSNDISFMTAVASGFLHCVFVHIFFWKDHRETNTVFF